MGKSPIGRYWKWVNNPPDAIPLDQFLDERIKTRTMLENYDRQFRLSQQQASHSERIRREIAIRHKMIKRGAFLEMMDKQAAEIRRLQANPPKETPKWISTLSCRARPYFDYIVLILLQTVGTALLYGLLIAGLFYLLFG